MRTATRIGLMLWVALAACESDATRKQRLLLRGNDALAQQQFAEAIRFYEGALAIDSCFVEALNNWGTALYRQKDYAHAAERYTQALNCNPQYLSALLNRANTWFGLKQYARSLTDAQQAANINDTLPAYLLSGMACVALGKYDDAKRYFKRAIAADPEQVEAKVNLAVVLYYLAEYDNAESILQELLQKNATEAEAWNTMGMIALARERWDEALKYFEESIRLSRNAHYLNNRGFARLMKGEPDKALEDINAGMVLDPQNAWAYRNKGIYYLLAGDAAAAIRLMEQALQMDERVENINAWLAEAYHKAGKAEAACRYARLSAERAERKKPSVKCR